MEERGCRCNASSGRLSGHPDARRQGQLGSKVCSAGRTFELQCEG